MKRRVVMFDVDGVLADFSSAYDRQCVALGIAPPGPDAPWDAKWDGRVWDVIKKTVGWWLFLQTIPEARVFRRINALQNTHDVYFVTARPGLAVKQQTETWLRMQGIEDPTVILSSKKGEAAAVLGADFSIEDKAGNAVYIAYQSKTKSFIVDRPYNQFDPQMLGSKVVRIKEIEQFLAAIELEDA
jgi:uncharacterized HAD superfamily protein